MAKTKAVGYFVLGKYLLLTLCAVMTLLNYLDRTVISYAINPIQHLFHMNNTMFGLTMTLFALGTVSANWLSGLIVDFVSLNRAWLIALIAWSVAMILQGMTAVLLLFFVLRYCLGVFEGFNFPAMNKAIASNIKPRSVSRYMAIALVGVPLSNLLGAPLLSRMIIDFNWQFTFICLGIAGLIMAILWFLLSWFKAKGGRGPLFNKQDKEKIRHLRRNSLKITWMLIKDRSMLSIYWSFFTFGYILFFAITWLPGYLMQTFHINLTSAGLFLMLPWGLSCCTIILGGYLSDFLCERLKSYRIARTYLIIACQVIAGLFFIPVVLTHSLNVSVVCLSIAIAMALMPNAPYYSACSDLHILETGTATGIMITFFSLSGLISPVLTGYLSDLLGGFDAPIIILIVLLATSVVGLFCFNHYPDDN